MVEKLNKIKAIKADIKSALINAGISDVSDVFSTYPVLIKSLKPEDIYSTFFEYVPDEYIEIEEDGYIVKYEKYKYIYADDVFVAGQEIEREVKKIVAIDATTTDGSEIIINYSGGTLTTENGKLYGIYPGDFISVQNLEKAVTLEINTDYLPGNVLDYKVAGSSASTPNANIKEITLTCRNATALNGYAKNCSVLKTFIINASDELENIEELCQYDRGCQISQLTINDAHNIKRVTRSCHGNSVGPDGEVLTISLTNCDYINGFLCRKGFKRINLIGPFSGHIITDTKYSAWDSWNYSQSGSLQELYGLDVSQISDDSDFSLFTTQNNKTVECAFNNLTRCKVDGLGVSTQIINQKVYPYSSKWNEEDIIYSFSNIAPTDNPDAKVYTSSAVKSVFNSKPELVGLITERGYTVLL